MLQTAIRVMDRKTRAMEAGSEANHQIPEGVQEYLDTPYQGAEGVPLAVDIFRAKTGDLRLHGGGLVVGTRKMSRTFCENLASHGFLVFAPEYRRITETDVFREFGDITAAFSCISGILEEYGGDPEQVTVASESAGSFLALYAIAAMNSAELREQFGLSASPLRVHALACFSGMFYTARRDPVGLVYSRNLYGEKRKDAAFMRKMNPESPEIMEKLPPVFLAGSAADILRGYTKRYAAALRRAGHPCELLYFKKNRELTHAFPALKPELQESRKVLEKMVEWIG